MGSSQTKVEPEEDELPKQTEADKNNPDNKALDVGTDFGGPCKKRRCTDCLCSILLIAAWFCMTVVGVACIPGSPLGYEQTGLHKGNPYKLIRGIDYKDRVCGIDDDVKDKVKMYYLPTGSGVCIKKCPKEQNAEAFHCTDDAQEKLNDIATAASTGWEALYVAKGYEMVKSCNTDPECASATSLRRCKCCAPYYPTSDMMDYCISDDAVSAASTATDAAADQAEAATAPCPDVEVITSGTPAPTPLCGAAKVAESEERDYTEKMYADVYLTVWYIFGFGFFGAIFVGFVYTFILRIPGVLALVVWGIIAAVLVFFLALAGLCYQTSMAWADDEDRDKNQANGMKYLAYFFAGCGGLWACTICCLRKRIALAIGITKEAAKCIAAMPLIILFPILQVLALIIFVIPWFIYCLYLGSSGEMETVGGARQMVYDDTTFKAGWYMIFVYYWSSEFIIAIGQIIIALAVSTWYFTRDKAKIGSQTVIWSFRQGAHYHWGTAAFGSLIIAIIKTIRAAVKYIQKKAAKSRFKKVVMVVLCAIDCCLWCIEKCMKFINKNAYIQTAIFGHSFCKAARCAFFLILRNIARIAALSIVSGFVLLLGKLVITAGATFLCYVCLAYGPEADNLNYIWLPLVFTAIIAFYVAAMFNEVWGMAMSTILQCFCADEEIYKGDKDAMYAGNDLKATVSNSNKGKYAKKVGVAPSSAKDEEEDAVI